ncbi:MAG: CoB--CoM heterodisulfide reductase iron-sulfur subunit A family protein [Candidatus Bathyarchaeia archaeon]
MEKSVLVVGAGISGIQAALDLAEAGVNVYLVEKAPSIGGRMAQFDKIYPTLENSLEILMPKMIEVAERQNIRLLTNTEVVSVEGSLGNFKVKILRKPRYVEENKCIGCGDCVKVCPVSMPDKFNEGLKQTKAISIYSPNAVPKLAIINPDYCLQLSGKEKCAKCVEACEAKAINFEQRPEESIINVGAIILAVGADIFDASKAPEIGYGRFKNVVSNIEFERILAASGPTGGKILCPQDGKTPKCIVFISCVGCRDKRFYQHCCNVGCMVNIKQAITARDKLGENAEIYICFNDVRAFGKGYEELYEKARNLGVNFLAGIPAEVRSNSDGTLYVGVYEKTLNRLLELHANLVVLTNGVVPKKDFVEISKLFQVPLGADGFLKEAHPKMQPFESSVAGIFLVGTCSGPKGISECIAQASGAAAKALILLSREAEGLK